MNVLYNFPKLNFHNAFSKTFTINFFDKHFGITLILFKYGVKLTPVYKNAGIKNHFNAIILALKYYLLKPYK